MKALDSLLARHKPGDVVRVDVTQRGRRKTIRMTLQGSPRLRLVTYESAGIPLSDEMRAFRGSWLGSKGGTP